MTCVMVPPHVVLISTTLSSMVYYYSYWYLNEWVGGILLPFELLDELFLLELSYLTFNLF